MVGRAVVHRLFPLRVFDLLTQCPLEREYLFGMRNVEENGTP